MKTIVKEVKFNTLKHGDKFYLSNLFGYVVTGNCKYNCELNGSYGILPSNTIVRIKEIVNTFEDIPIYGFGKFPKDIGYDSTTFLKVSSLDYNFVKFDITGNIIVDSTTLPVKDMKQIVMPVNVCVKD